MLRYVLAIFGLVGAGFAGSVVATEFQSVRQLAIPAQDFMLSLADNDDFQFAPAMASLTEENQMQACIDRQTSGLYDVHRIETQVNLSRACLSRAQTILSASPTRSAAHLARAVSLARLGQTADAIAALGRSRETGPFEGWLADRRLTLGFLIIQNPDTSDATRGKVLALIEPDVTVMASAGILLDDLVTLYRAYPDMDDWIISQMEARPDAEQRRFFYRVRKAIAGEGPQ